MLRVTRNGIVVVIPAILAVRVASAAEARVIHHAAIRFGVARPPSKSTVSDSGLSGPCDNFCFQTSFVTEYNGEVRAFDFTMDLFDGEDWYRDARAHVPGHFPVGGQFNTAAPDGD